ncbi:XRE family transcriptional regulator [Hahella sp. KA22]|uniref:XRE family transcriptional regulator n=1 Tax=Hahella sp. KA22 TaxID=1628392 RepID=UPI000FDD10D7|nr:XRE family transcriptional regulator [Hahella sp. KA22]AZZ94707.1 XRE family transcriptional regulator [Hahella sp. KA22]QAY58080.1 XRE family transcriptional regulator [Hahella sp. KA22]
MRLKAGERLKGLRELAGFTRQEFSNITNIELTRLTNLEKLKARVAEDEYEKLGLLFPDIIQWLAFEGDISLEALRVSENKLCRLLAARFEAGQIPEGYYFEEVIKQ